MPDPIPGLNDVQSAGRGVKPASGIEASKPTVKVSTVGDDVSAAAVPVSIVLGAQILAEKTESKLLELALKMVTGLKPPPIAGEAPGLTPGAILLLLPQPLGVLPERFFMAKPRIPGTNIFLDPIHTGKSFLERREQRKRDEAAQAQTEQFRALVPKLTDAQLTELLESRDIQHQFLALVDPREIESALIAEGRKRKAVADSRDAEERFRSLSHEWYHDDQFGQGIIDPFFAANGPDP